MVANLFTSGDHDSPWDSERENFLTSPLEGTSLPFPTCPSARIIKFYVGLGVIDKSVTRGAMA